MEQEKPLIDGLLRRGEIMNLVAAPKARKSWLVMELATCIEQGTLWLGRFQCSPASVLLIDNELRLPTLKSRAKAICEAKGSTGNNGVKILSVRGKHFDLDDVEHYIRKTGAEVVILDALYRFFPAKFDENSNADMTRLYNQLDRLATSTGVAIIIVHHASKGGQTMKAASDVGSGAGAQSRAADAHVVLRPVKQDADQAREQRAFLDAIGRSFPPVGRVELEWKFPLWQSVDPLAYTPSDDVAADVAKYFKDEFETSGTIQTRSGLSEGSWQRLRKKAIDTGLIECKVDGKQRLYRKAEDKPF